MENTAFRFEYKPRTGSEAMCEALLDEGVEHLFGYPTAAVASVPKLFDATAP